MKPGGLLLATALLACGAGAEVRAHEFRACKGVADRLAVRELRVSPDPPQAGHPITVTVSGTPAMDVAGGEVTVDIKVFGVLVSEQRFDLCSVATCPLAKDQAVTAAIKQDIPAETPDKIPALVRVTITSSAGEVVSCLETTVQLADKSLTEEEAQEKPAFGLVRAELKFLFDRWKQQFAKKIAQSAEQHRLGVFSKNVFRIALHNADRTSTFKMAMNEFGDMTEQEFAQTHLSGLRAGFRPETRLSEDGSNLITLRGSLVDPPAEVDWTQRGAVTPVKNQGSCGSCWAFSAVAAIESQYFIKTGNLVEMSEQLLVSCDGDGVHGGVDYACQGGFMDNAFDWVQHSTSGLCTEADYPYSSGTTSARGECRMAECTPVPGSQVQGYVDVPPTEAALVTAVAEHGPLSVAIEADQAAFQFYHSGVLHGQCGNSLNHGVLVVGYGVDADTGSPFWKVKNSWGSGWGEAGYVRIQRGKRWPSRYGECGIASKASYPVF